MHRHACEAADGCSWRHTAWGVWWRRKAGRARGKCAVSAGRSDVWWRLHGRSSRDGVGTSSRAARRRGRAAHEHRGHGLDIGQDVVLLGLCSELAFGLVAVALALAVLLVGVLDRDGLVDEILVVHVSDGVVRRLEGRVADEAVALGHALVVACDLGRRHELAEAAERVVQDLLVHGRVEVAHEELGPHVREPLLVRRRLVDPQRLAEQTDAVHAPGRVVGIRLRVELDEAEGLVRLRHAVLGQVHVHHRPHLEHELVYEGIVGPLIDIAHIYSRLLVLFPVP